MWKQGKKSEYKVESIFKIFIYVQRTGGAGLCGPGTWPGVVPNLLLFDSGSLIIVKLRQINVNNAYIVKDSESFFI
jgi:hypothetical protein